MSNRNMWLIFISMAASLTGCGDDGTNKHGSTFEGKWSCESRHGSSALFIASIRNNGGNNYIIDLSTSRDGIESSSSNKSAATYKDGMLESPTKFGTLSIDKQSGKLIGMGSLCRDGEMSRVE